MKILIFLVMLSVIGIGTVFAEPVTTQIIYDEKTLVVDEPIMIMTVISNNQDVPQNFHTLLKLKMMTEL